MADALRFAIIGSRSLHPLGKEPHPAAFAFLRAFMDALPSDALIRSGGARGPDSWAYDYAQARGLPRPLVFLPNYDKHGRGAAFIRNHTIIDNCDGVLAVYDGFSRGTAHSLDYAKRKGKPMRVECFIPSRG